MRNKFELKVYKSLKKQKVKFTYETVKIPYVLAKHYIPDFILETRLGKIYLECKGYLRPEDKAKLVAVKRQNPALDIRLLFYASNKRNIRWAEKVGIRYAVAKVPKEWLDGL